MKSSNSLLLVTVLPILGCAAAPAPLARVPAASAAPADIDPPGDLVRGQPVERALARGERHEYRLELGRDQFLLVVAEQRGVDVIVKVRGPDGAAVAQSDSTHELRGPEPVPLFTRGAGVYTISVEAARRDAEPGRYALTLARAQAAAADPAGRVAQLMSYWARRDRPGAAVAVVVDGALAFSGGWGSANLEYDIPIEPNTVFQVASVAKQFTAFAVFMLAARGALSLDDLAQKYVAELPPSGADIAVRHLLGHTSGLRDQWSLLSLAGVRMDDVITQRDILALVGKQTRLDFAPGSEFSYSNTGYTVLAEVVAKVSGQSLRAFSAEHMFTPLGMTHTQFRDDHESIVRGRAQSYSLRPDGAGFMVHTLSHATVGATGLYTTVEDLARWAINLDTGAVGGAAVVEAMHRRARLDSGEELPYAAGLYFGAYRGIEFVGHGGSDAGYRAALLRFPKYHFAVAVASNDGDFRATDIAQEIAAMYLAEHLTDDAAPAGADDTSAAPDASALAAYAGAFKLENGMEVEILADGDKLALRLPGMADVTLVARAEHVFYVAPFDALLTFVPGSAGAVDELVFRQGGALIPGHRAVAGGPLTNHPDELVGRYFSPELETYYAISERQGQLWASHWRNGEIPLTATAADEFSSPEWYMAEVAFVREGGAVTGMRVSGPRMREVWFARVSATQDARTRPPTSARPAPGDR